MAVYFPMDSRGEDEGQIEDEPVIEEEVENVLNEKLLIVYEVRLG